MTTAAPDIDEAFRAALSADAAVTPPDIPPPPRHDPPVDPGAPHGRDPESGEPLAPFGINKKTGLPNLRRPGPGKPKAAEKARVTKVLPAAAGRPAGAGPAAKADYSEELAGFGQTVWMAGCSLPPTRPYAHLLKQCLPGMVGAWNQAAQQNATVRGYVEKLSGDSSWAWVVPVIVTTVPFAMGCLELSRKEKDPARAAEKKEIKTKMAAEAEAEFKEFIGAHMAEFEREAAAAEAA